MATTTPQHVGSAQAKRQVPHLENGDCLDAEEFLRRWDAMPELKQAELINGVVFMNAAQRYTVHGNPAGRLYSWLAFYLANTPGVEFGVETTVALLKGPSFVQPDACLFLPSHAGGRCQINEDGLLNGPPELVVEIAASSASRDLHQKKVLYEQAGVQEYIVWDVYGENLLWFLNQSGAFQQQTPDTDGILESHVFPGLWLNPAALLAGKLKEVRATVEMGTAQPEHAAFVKELESKSQPE